jgi:hypothetical protein
MPSYPISIRRCQHLKVNGTQCGSPALSDQKYCYYHLQCHQKKMEINMNLPEGGTITLPNLEDANSIQLGLAEVMRLLVTSQIDHRTAALLLHALRTAAVNIKRVSLEPDPTLVVIDPDCVKERPIGATAWSTVEGRDYDDLKKADLAQDDSVKDAVDPEEAERGRKFMAHYKHLTNGLARDPEFLDRPHSFGGEREGSSSSAGTAAGPTAERLSGG